MGIRGLICQREDHDQRLLAQRAKGFVDRLRPDHARGAVLDWPPGLSVTPIRGPQPSNATPPPATARIASSRRGTSPPLATYPRAPASRALRTASRSSRPL